METYPLLTNCDLRLFISLFQQFYFHFVVGWVYVEVVVVRGESIVFCAQTSMPIWCFTKAHISFRSVNERVKGIRQGAALQLRRTDEARGYSLCRDSRCEG